MISANIVCFNESNKLERCLKSISDFADEIIIIDLGSADNVEKVCARFNAKIYKHSFVPYVELVRNYAISKTSGDWVLVLDPDEQVTNSLKKKLKEQIKNAQYAAINIPRKNIFFNKWIKHTNWWPDRHIRFFKKDKVKWCDKIHSYPIVEGSTLNLEAKEDLAIWHYGYKIINEFIERQNRYSSIEAQNLFDLGERFSWISFFWKPLREFIVRFIRHLGFLDGFTGFTLTFLIMIYQLQVMVKLWELEKNK